MDLETNDGDLGINEGDLEINDVEFDHDGSFNNGPDIYYNYNFESLGDCTLLNSNLIDVSKVSFDINVKNEGDPSDITKKPHQNNLSPPNKMRKMSRNNDNQRIIQISKYGKDEWQELMKRKSRKTDSMRNSTHTTNGHFNKYSSKLIDKDDNNNDTSNTFNGIHNNTDIFIGSENLTERNYHLNEKTQLNNKAVKSTTLKWMLLQEMENYNKYRNSVKDKLRRDRNLAKHQARLNNQTSRVIYAEVYVTSPKVSGSIYKPRKLFPGDLSATDQSSIESLNSITVHVENGLTDTELSDTSKHQSSIESLNSLYQITVEPLPEEHDLIYTDVSEITKHQSSIESLQLFSPTTVNPMLHDLIDMEVLDKSKNGEFGNTQVEQLNRTEDEEQQSAKTIQLYGTVEHMEVEETNKTHRSPPLDQKEISKRTLRCVFSDRNHKNVEEKMNYLKTKIYNTRSKNKTVATQKNMKVPKFRHIRKITSDMVYFTLQHLKYKIIRLDKVDLSNKDIKDSIYSISKCINLDMCEDISPTFDVNQVVIYLAIKGANDVIAYLEVEPANAAFTLLKYDGMDFAYTSQTATTVKVGICNIWVYKEYRRNKIATNLLNICRFNFTNERLPKDLISFSHITKDLFKFASSYIGGKDKIKLYAV